MSGGSFNYLSSQDPDQLMNMESELQSMVDYLNNNGAEDAAKETYELVLIMRQFRVRADVTAKRLAEVWWAAELVTSGDSSFEELTKALKEYRGG
jgi:hypothetical protein